MNSKRYAVVVLLVIALVLSGCSSFNTVALTKPPKIKSGKDLTFFVTSDTHYLAKSLTDGGEAFQQFMKSGDGRQLDYMEELMSSFERDIKNKKPEVLILSGDLTNNGEKDSHLELAKKLKAIKDSGTMVYVVPGNHDILNPYARSFKGSDQYVADYITEKEFSKIYGDFGYNDAVLRDKNSLSYLVAPSEDLWLLMLDTAKYRGNIASGAPQADGEIKPETLEWIKKCSALAKKNNAKLIAVMHHSLINHSENLNKGFTINNSKEALEVFQQEGIELSLTGHIHLQDIKSYSKNDNTIYDIASACFGRYPQEYGVLKYSKNSGFDYSVNRIDVEGWAKETGSTDKNLLGFKEFSKKLVSNTSATKVFLALEDSGFTDKQIDLMFKTYVDLVCSYYEGKKPDNIEEIKNSEGYKLWLKFDDGSTQKRVLSLANSTVDNTKLHIPVKK